MKKSLQLFSLFILIFYSFSCFASGSKRILVIHSYSQDYPWTKGQHQGFADELKSASAIIKTEYLDTKRVTYNRQYAKLYRNFIKKKYSTFKAHAIYITDDNALKFALSHLRPLYPYTPIFFSGVNNYAQIEKLNPFLETGVFEKKEIKPNLNLIDKLFTNAETSKKELLIIGDESQTYKNIKVEIEKELSNLPSLDINFVSNNNLTLILDKINTHNNAVILLTTVGAIKGPDQSLLTLEHIITSMSKLDKKIIFSMEDGYLFDGVLGGYVTSADKQGSSAAKLLSAYFDGTTMETLKPLTTSPNEYIFNDRVLNSLNIELPEEFIKISKLLYPRLSFYQRYEKILQIIFVLLLLTLIISSFVYFLFISRKTKQLAHANLTITKQADNLESEVLQRTNELTKSHEQLKLALCSANLGMWDWQPIENKLYTNDIFLTMLGHTADALPQTFERWESLIHPNDLKKVRSMLQPFIEHDDGLYRCEHRMRAANNTWHWILDVGQVIQRDSNGKASRFIGIHIDITEQKQFQEDILLSRANAERANKAKSEFLANMSHELRTPMHGVLSFASLGIDIQDESSNEKNLRYFTNIQTSGERLMCLLDDLLDLAKLESGKMELEYKHNNLQTVIESCVAEQYARLHELDINIIYIKSDFNNEGDFDGARIGQVITNLLSNAIKFSPQGKSIDFTITADEIKMDSIAQMQPALHFTIRDYGKGLLESETELLFNKFEQGSDTIVGTTKGTGLGLAISKEIIHLHKGKLWAENHAEGGAVFNFIIPVNHENEYIDVINAAAI